MTPKIFQVLAVAVIAALTYVRPENLLFNQGDALHFPFYSGRWFSPGFPAATGLKFTKSDGVVQPRVLGVIDFLLLNRLTARVNQLEEAMKNLNENSQATADQLASINSDLSTLKNTVDETKNEVETIKVDLGTITTTANDLASVKSELSKLKSTVDETKNEVAAIQVDLGTITLATDKIPAIAANLKNLNDAVTIISKPTSIGSIPTSCDDLRKLGNIKSGLYNIKSSGKMGAVYCDFTLETTQEGFQSRVGFLDVQTLPVYFYVQKSAIAVGTVEKIPFEIENLNVGGAMNINTGIFTAPVDGTYFFAFSGIVAVPPGQVNKLYVMNLKLNGNDVGGTAFQDALAGSQLTTVIHLEATLKLRKNDQIWLSANDFGYNFVLIANTFSSFTGSLLAEEIPILQ